MSTHVETTDRLLALTSSITELCDGDEHTNRWILIGALLDLAHQGVPGVEKAIRAAAREHGIRPPLDL